MKMTNVKGLMSITGFVLAFAMFGLFIVVSRNNATACKPEDNAETWQREINMEMLSFGDTYVREAKVIRWVDGDTVDLQIDLGYRIFIRERIRLLEVDTPEKGQPNFRKATLMSRKYAPEGKRCLIRSESARRDKSDHWFGIIYVPGQGSTLNEVLIQAGWPYKKK